MIREIKFKGYAVDEMVNSQWIYGTGIHRTVFAEHFAKEVGQSSETFIWTESGWIQIVEGSQSQYTNMKDVNGIEIYEGDIVEYFNHDTNELFVGAVTMYDGSWWIDSGVDAIYLFHECNEVKVVANVFEK